MKNYLVTILLIISFSWGFGGCKKFLDVVPPAVGTLEYAFRNRNEAEKYLFTCYNALQQRSSIQHDPWFATGGDLVYPHEYLGATFLYYPGFELIKGTVQRPDNVILDYWNGGNGAPNYFDAIRRCNTFLENVDKPIDLTSGEKARWIAEAKFLKAYYHFHLCKMYGPIPVIRENIPITAPTQEFRASREPVDTVLNYVADLLDQASGDLPLQISNLEQELGRITQTIAKALKAEVRVAQASPLFNGNPDYANLTNKDGSPLFSQTVDEGLWTVAANACKEAIELAESAELGLYTFIIPTNVTASLTDSLKKEMSFRGAITEEWDKNKELIWAVNGSFPMQLQMHPKIVSASQNPRGMNTVGCPLTVTDLFYTNNGVPIDEDRLWDYNDRFSLQNGDDEHKYYLKPNYQTIKNNFNREVRYYASFGFDGSRWVGNARLSNNTNDLYNIEGKGPSAISGVTNRESGNIIGIWPKKLCNWLSVFPNTNSSISIVNYRLPLIRMADLYLLYAECLNETVGPSPEVYKYVDLVRARTGLKGVVESWANYSTLPSKPLNKAGMREIIHRERRIELCMEGKAGWDTRRWKEYLESANRAYQGWSVFTTTGSEYYQPVTFYSPTITLKDYLWPISANELLVNENLVQNPFW